MQEKRMVRHREGELGVLGLWRSSVAILVDLASEEGMWKPAFPTSIQSAALLLFAIFSLQALLACLVCTAGVGP